MGRKEDFYHEQQDISLRYAEWQVRRNEENLKQLKTVCVVLSKGKEGREGRKTSEALHRNHRKFSIS